MLTNCHCRTTQANPVRGSDLRYTASIAAFTGIPAYGQILLRQLLFTLGPFWSFINTQKSRVNGVLHCALLLHVAMQIGLSHLSEKRAWRLVSGDSGARLRRHRPAFPADCPHLVDFHCSKRCEYQRILGVSSKWPGLFT